MTRAPVRRVNRRPMSISQSSQPIPTLIRMRTKNRRATQRAASPVTMPEPIVDELPAINATVAHESDSLWISNRRKDGKIATDAFLLLNDDEGILNPSSMGKKCTMSCHAAFCIRPAFQ